MDRITYSRDRNLHNAIIMSCCSMDVKSLKVVFWDETLGIVTSFAHKAQKREVFAPFFSVSLKGTADLTFLYTADNYKPIFKELNCPVANFTMLLVNSFIIYSGKKYYLDSDLYRCYQAYVSCINKENHVDIALILLLLLLKNMGFSLESTHYLSGTSYPSSIHEVIKAILYSDTCKKRIWNIAIKQWLHLNSCNKDIIIKTWERNFIRA